jgi:phosphatidylglycerophosphatase A
MEVSEFLGRKRTYLKGKSSGFTLVAKFLATGCGVGYLPLAPGTWGALAAVLLILAVYQLPGSTAFAIHVGLVSVLFPVAWFTSSQVTKVEGESDPAYVVIDEIVGQLVCLLFVPITPLSLLLGFALFRSFDILKPFPIRRSERLPGGLGIVIDDVIAAIYAGIVLRLIHAG